VALQDEFVAVTLPYHAEQLSARRRLVAEAEQALARASGARPGIVVGRPRIVLLLVEGAWAEAEALARAGKAANPLAFLARHRGDWSGAWMQVDARLPLGPPTEPGEAFFSTATEMQRLAADLALATGNVALARAWLAAHDRWLAWSGASWGRAEGHLGWAGYHRAIGEPAAARARAECALAQATDPRQPLALLAAHRTLGELATDAGRHADAATHLDAALALADACVAVYERALTLLALAELHRARGNREATQAALDTAREILVPLGAAPALARADALAAKLALVRPATGHPDGLTAREVDVLRLVAGGGSNREIAAALSVSERTVGRHLENLYRKIAARNRADATAYALRHNLT
jgi:ATP/maltotriose-dependent transcriptional regulator MalT